MKTNLDLGACGQPAGPSYQAKLADQLKGHQSKVKVKKSSVKKKAKPKQKLKKTEVCVKKPPLEAKIKTGGEEGKFTRMRSVFEPGKVDVQKEEEGKGGCQKNVMLKQSWSSSGQYSEVHQSLRR